MQNNAQNLLVICLCARWCGVCVDYQNTFKGVAAQFTNHRFASLDIEDDAALLESVGPVDLTDVVDFPTVLIANSSQGILFLGPVMPQSQTLERLIQAGESSSLTRPRQPVVSLEHLQALLQTLESRLFRVK